MKHYQRQHNRGQNKIMKKHVREGTRNQDTTWHGLMPVKTFDLLKKMADLPEEYSLHFPKDLKLHRLQLPICCVSSCHLSRYVPQGHSGSAHHCMLEITVTRVTTLTCFTDDALPTTFVKLTILTRKLGC